MIHEFYNYEDLNVLQDFLDKFWAMDVNEKWHFKTW